jgi:hypothetical protein
MTARNSPVAVLLSPALQKIQHKNPLLEDQTVILQDREEEISAHQDLKLRARAANDRKRDGLLDFTSDVSDILCSLHCQFNHSSFGD